MPENSEESSHGYDFYDDPLYLSSSDQPFSHLVSPLFNGNDFLSWKQDILMALASKNKDCFIDGMLPQPPKTDKKFYQWVRCDLMVMKWILNSLDKSVRHNLKYVKSAKELWGELLERYGQANAIEIYQLKKGLDAVSQSNLSLVEYYSKFKNYWETLDSLDPIPQCSCGKIAQCPCTLMKRIVVRENNSKLIQFLMGLNTGFDNIKTQILSMDPSAYASFKVVDANTREKKEKKYCSHCKMNNHNLDECFWVNECDYCGKPGHKIDKCYRLVGFPSDKTAKPPAKPAKPKPKNFGGKSGYKKSANTVDVIEHNDSEDDHPLVQSSDASTSQSFDLNILDGLVTSVVDQVLKRISGNMPSLSSSNFAGMVPNSLANVVHHNLFLHDWIIDTGASDHMTFNIRLLHNVRILAKSLPIGLPDGSIKHVSKVGDVRLNDKILLQNVLLIPDFKQNLLSVSKLIDDNKLFAVFSDANCSFKDLSTKLVIATGRRIGDLYRFQKFNTQDLVNKVVSIVSKTLGCTSFVSQSLHSANSSSCSASVDLLHARLGHIGFDKLKYVNTLHNNGKKAKHCETCVLSKHHLFLLVPLKLPVFLN
ncbi:uncharacterized protein LOC141632995 [Silene latifolia]|uniref:uncharacterized protein LOC141632995 n=1 Tax=Silene latifolia TaxID=37657 RepID=UPI003D777DE9